MCVVSRSEWPGEARGQEDERGAWLWVAPVGGEAGAAQEEELSVSPHPPSLQGLHISY